MNTLRDMIHQLRDVMTMGKEYIDKYTLTSYRNYIMFNKEDGTKIECTEKFVKHWETRGFENIGSIVRLSKSKRIKSIAQDVQ